MDRRLRQRYRQMNPLARLGIAAGAFAVVAGAVVWVGNPNLESQGSGPATTGWTAPTEPGTTTTAAPPPPGFPTMDFPPPMSKAPEGQPQPVPTKFGLTYSVPSSEHWQATNDAVLGWSDPDGSSIATYGAGSRYRHTYCPDVKGAALARVGVTGRNAVDIDTAAREEVAKAERIFSDKSGRKPQVELRGPVSFEVSARPAVRYTAVLTDIPKETSCDPDQAHFDIVATSGYASAEVVLLMVEQHRGLPDALPDDDVEAIIASLRKTE
ncbi:hypothetical protein [Nocardia puris]|uniref:DUF8017 domain-containing protein n=2 Tax=Nocardia puris TaxID=208602 RepID=A0A366D303_9NOCA|nr:hypothetical protein [Nocardia puris]RBO84295.1 hypothetical protein DFR74_117116 [Nocardia puris]